LQDHPLHDAPTYPRPGLLDREYTLIAPPAVEIAAHEDVSWILEVIFELAGNRAHGCEVSLEHGFLSFDGGS
jgi:hypothetical protein